MHVTGSSRVRHIGRYQILEELGRGGMGVVYRALDPTIGRTVALKTVCLSSTSGSPEDKGDWKQRFLAEARSAGSLCHPHIVSIYDVGAERGYAYLVMEFVEGCTLDKLMSPGAPMELATAIPLLKQIGETLDHVHARGIVHRDLKPANILVQFDHTIKLTDFGIAKVLSDPKLTRTGQIIGTPYYLSPEQIQGHPVSPRADQFSLAVLAYEMLTGQKPFTGDSFSAVLFSILGQEPLALHTVDPDLDHELDQVLRHGLAKAPSERYSSCAEFINRLDAVLAKKGASLPTLSGIEKPVWLSADPGGPSARSGLPQWFWAGILAATASLALLFTLVVKIPNHHRSNEQTAASQRSVQPEMVPRKDGTPTSAGQERPIRPTHLGQTISRGSLPAVGGSEVGHSRSTSQPMLETAQKLQLFTKPTGATATFDGDSTCTTPCTVQLSPGRHSVQVSLAGYTSIRELFELPMQSELSFALHEAIGGLLVTSSPLGALIALNGEVRPEKTPAALRLPVGQYRVEISKEGYIPRLVNVTVEDGKGQPVHCELPPL